MLVLSPLHVQAWLFLYGECGVPRDHTKNTKYLWMQLPTYQKGSAITAAKHREDLGMRTLEGKDPIPFAAYVHLAKILLRSRNPACCCEFVFTSGLESNLKSESSSESQHRSHWSAGGLSKVPHWYHKDRPGGNEAS